MHNLALPGLADTAAEHGETLPWLLSSRRLYVAANRGPVHYRLRGSTLEKAHAAGGLVTALSGIAGRAPMTWVATASGAGDRLMAKQPALGISKQSLLRLRFVVPTEEALDWFYGQFSNPILWFLQHGMWDLVRRSDIMDTMERGWMLGYRPVNEAFAQTIEQEVRGELRPVILTHDYHLYLLPGLLRKRLPGALLQHFTHIPWPAPDGWEPLLPAFRRQLCKGLLGTDVAGFQTETSAVNFLRCCERFVPGARVDYARATVSLDGRATRVRAYPISIDPDGLRGLAASPEVSRHKERLKPLLTTPTIVRVDRLDPSKNVALGFKAFGRLLERRPDLVGRARFLAFLVPSRETVPEYRRYAQEVWREVGLVNDRFGREGWKPIEVFYEDNRAQAIAGMALADVLLVNPIADGMNLVAKEGPIVSERHAVLVLSRECGAHTQLGSAALSVSPKDVAATALALEQALEMPLPERKRRLAALRAAVEASDLSWWMQRQVEDLLPHSKPPILAGAVGDRLG